MGKTKKANYNKTKTEEIIGVTSEDANYTIYSLDKGGRWNIKPVEEEIDPHEARRNKTAREAENRLQKKEEYKLNLNCAPKNIKKTDGVKDWYGSRKSWWINDRTDLPEKLQKEKKIEVDEDEIIENPDSVQQPVGKIKARVDSDDDSLDSDESDEDVKIEFVKSTHSKKTKHLKEKKKGKKFKDDF